jgi:hypothetical protein
MNKNGKKIENQFRSSKQSRWPKATSPPQELDVWGQNEQIVFAKSSCLATDPSELLIK